jgi:hypothetical protein
MKITIDFDAAAARRLARSGAWALVALAIAYPVYVTGSQVGTLVQFQPGQVIKSADFNANFQAIQTAVDDNDKRIGNLTLLATTAKSDLVSAVNEVRSGGGLAVVVNSPLTGNGTTGSPLGLSTSFLPLSGGQLTGAIGGTVADFTAPGTMPSMFAAAAPAAVTGATTGTAGNTALQVTGSVGGASQSGKAGLGGTGASFTGGTGGLSSGGTPGPNGDGGTGLSVSGGLGGFGGTGAVGVGGDGISAAGGPGLAGTSGGSAIIARGGIASGTPTTGTGGTGINAIGGVGGATGNGGVGIFAMGGMGGTPGGAAVFGGNVSINPANGQLGDLFVTNHTQSTTLTVTGAKAFKIDHPLDPENKFLFHSCVESPDMKNVYDGIAVLDAKGEAVIEMPEWFEALNRDFRYQLTCVGGYAPVYVAEKVNANRFKIAGGRAGLEVSWQLTGIRKDDYAEAHRVQVEVEKSASERGRYLTPVEHGKPASLRIGAATETALAPAGTPQPR